MGLLDRIRPQPAWQHADPEVRAGAIDALGDDQPDILIALARTDTSPVVRRAALQRVTDPHVLSAMASEDPDETIRQQAAARLTDVALVITDAVAGLAAAAALGDAKLLATLARSAALECVAQAALTRLADERLIASVARRSTHSLVRLAALSRVTAAEALTDVALRTEHTDTALAALDRLLDPVQLESIALRGRNKVASRRASARLRALKQTTPPPDAHSATRLRQIEMCERIEALAKSDDPDRLMPGLNDAQLAWSDLVPEVDDDLADRFAAACVAVRERLMVIEADRTERTRRDQATALQRTERHALCEDIARLGGADALERLADLRGRWTALNVWTHPEAPVFERRFADACAACEARHRKWIEARATLERLCVAAERFADDPAFPADRDTRDHVAALRQEYRQLPEIAISLHPDLISRLAQADARLSDREAQVRDRRTQDQRDALRRLEQLAADTQALLDAQAPALKDLERRYREVKATMDQMPELPSRRDRDAIVARLKPLLSAVAPRLQELREAADWERWANAGVQEQLCVRTEALAAVSDPIEVAKALHEIENQWRQVATAPRERSQALWRRFQAAHHRVRGRLQQHFAEQAAERAANLQKKESLCAQAESLQSSTDWLKTAESIKALQAEWKTIGPVARGQEKAVWERFRQACDRFFSRRNEDLAHRKAMWAENLSKKEALCARAEACADSTDWDAAMAEIRKMQSEWRVVGPVRRSKSEALWQRFHTATERFFDRYRQRDRLALEAQLGERERVRAELEALAASAPDGAPSGPPDGVASALRRLIHQWEAAGAVPRELGADLSEQFSRALTAAIDAHRSALAGSEFDTDRNRKTMEELCDRVERLISPTAPTDAAVSPSARLATMLREALASNTIGGRVDEEARWRAAVEDVKTAQAAWRRIGLVLDPARRELTARFDRLCRSFFDQRRATTSSPPARPRPPLRAKAERSDVKT